VIGRLFNNFTVTTPGRAAALLRGKIRRKFTVITLSGFLPSLPAISFLKAKRDTGRKIPARAIRI
jgi:hypothetical protein